MLAPDHPATELAALARHAVDELIDFWAHLPIDPIPEAVARRQLFQAVPALRDLCEALPRDSSAAA